MADEAPFKPTQETPSPIKPWVPLEPRERRDIKADVKEFLARKKNEAERAQIRHDARIAATAAKLEAAAEAELEAAAEAEREAAAAAEAERELAAVFPGK
jgi:hypothetical protein